MAQKKTLTAVCALALAICMGTAGAAGRSLVNGPHDGGHGFRGHYGGLRHGDWRSGAFRRRGYHRYYYGGDYVVVPGFDEWTPFPPTPQLPPPPPPLVPPTLELTCHHSQQKVMVPSETGGTRQIAITRC